MLIPRFPSSERSLPTASLGELATWIGKTGPAASRRPCRIHLSPYVLRGRPFLDENRGWLPADAGSP
jgi:hypothetical protein